MPGSWILRLIASVVLATLGPAAAGAIAPLPDQPAALVDGAGLLSGPSRARLSAQIERLAAEAGRHLTVLTVESLGDRRIDRFTAGLRAHWAPGEAAAPRLVLLVAWRERKVWLGEIGAAASLDPGALQAVIDDVILPAFQWRNFDRGIEAGLDALSRLILAQPDPPPGARTADERLTGAGAGRSTLAAALLLVIGAAMLLTRVAEVRVEEPLAR